MATIGVKFQTRTLLFEHKNAPRRSAQDRTAVSRSGQDCQEGSDQDSWVLRTWSRSRVCYRCIKFATTSQNLLACLDVLGL